MTAQVDIRIASLSFYVSEYMPRIMGFDVQLTNGSRSGDLRSKYKCKQETIHLEHVEVSQLSLKVDSMAERYQCYTGIRIQGL